MATLPAFVGVSLGDQGYAVAKIIKTAGATRSVADPAKAMAQYAQVWAEAEAQAYYAALKSRYKVTHQRRRRWRRAMPRQRAALRPSGAQELGASL